MHHPDIPVPQYFRSIYSSCGMKLCPLLYPGFHCAEDLILLGCDTVS